MATRNGVVSIGVADAYGIEATTPYFVTIDDTKTVAQLMTDVLDLVEQETLLTQGDLNQASVTIVALSGSTSSALGDVEKGALFNFSNASDSYATGYWIPDVNPVILNSSGLIDLTNADVTAFITWLTTAHTVITVVTKGVRALTSLKDALISFRKHRKPLSRKTKEV